MRTSYGTDKTGRLSSKANHQGMGTNIQNQPKKFRTYYIPEKDQVILSPDLSQAEAFVFVYKAHAEKLKQRMLKGEKIHAVVANWMHDKPISELTSDQYRDVKAVVYSSTYGVGINKLATIMERSVAETKVIKQKYDDVVPEVQRYHKDVEDQVNNTRLITNPYGRRRVFTGFINADTLRSAYSQYPQSTVVDTIDIGILGLWLIKSDDIYITAQVHDEAVISLPPNKVDWFTPYIKAHLETLREIEIDGELLVIPVDIGKVKKSWLK
jgi:DNA polymerase-1